MASISQLKLRPGSRLLKTLTPSLDLSCGIGSQRHSSTDTYHEYIISLKSRDVMTFPAGVMVGQIGVTACGCMGTVDVRWGVMRIGTAGENTKKESLMVNEPIYYKLETA